MLEIDEYGYSFVVKIAAEIALARCPVCRSRWRVLPADILPRKLYSLPVIECSVSLYDRGDLSLRNVVWDELHGDHAPSYTTLHGWTEGLGAYCLGRSFGEVIDALPASRILSELEARHSEMRSLQETPIEINPIRHHSQGRRERLEACKRFELSCGVLEAEDGWRLTKLNRLILSWGSSRGFGFRSAICCTAIAHRDRTVVATWSQTSTKEVLLCPIRGRSPTGDSR